MSRDVLSVPYVEGLALLGFAVVLIWLRLLKARLGEWLDQVLLTAGGYLRRRPGRAAENALRAAFAEFDRDLTAILGDLTRRDRPEP
ncbi:MAG TPA: hypothetical protein VGD91_03335 [Trebonia sp.]